MAKEVATIVCDNIRFEKGNKISLMGVYGSSIKVAKFPYVFPTFGFAQFWEGLQKKDTLRVEIRAEGSNPILVTGKPSKVAKEENDHVRILFNVSNLKINKSGEIKFYTYLEGKQKEVGHLHVVRIDKMPIEEIQKL